ncbi:MAG TPA: hypothetical protein DIS54_03475 [Candidatus Veblenbacteria bacterium]|nr:MAG: hypothetical protein UX50_C0016G0003 [Candidatus Beckwithbacteria bacterium GW2011_GWA1_46_30]HCM45856.1 hypothetical protein [Candidatus Veblenbacteria bacterium]
MLTTEDIKNLITAEREVFATKEDFGGLEQRLGERMDTLTTAVDAYAKKADTYHQEMSVLIHKVHRMEDWIQKVAEKVGIKYVT